MNNHLKTFLKTGSSYGAAMSGYFYLQHPGLVSIAIGIGAGAAFGGAMTAYQWRKEQKLRQRGITATDLRPIQERRIALTLDSEKSLERAKHALPAIRKFKPDSVSMSGRQITARTGLTWESFGENIKIIVEPAQSGASVYIRSSPRLATTTFDGGKGVENVEAFARALKAEA